MCAQEIRLPDSDSESEEEEEEEEEHVIVRAKWTIDDAANLDECVEKLEAFIDYLKSLKAMGWELRQPVSDDWGFLYKRN